jgi:hypothetical protein
MDAVGTVRVVTQDCRPNSFESKIIRGHAQAGNSTGNKNQNSETFAPVRLEGAAPTGSIVEARVTRLINTADSGKPMVEVTSVSDAEIFPGEATA